MKLSEYLKPLDAAARAEMAAESGTTWLHLRNIAFSGKACGIQLAVDIERISAGAIRRWDLRPDDWHRIWPELIGAEGAPDVPALATEVSDAG